MRSLSFTWYDSLQLPDSDTHTYVVVAVMQKYTNSKKTRAEVFLPIFNEVLRNLDSYWFSSWAYRPSLTDETLVDAAFLERYPQVSDPNASVPHLPDLGFPPVLAGTPANREGKYSHKVTDSHEVLPPTVTTPRSVPREMSKSNIPSKPPLTTQPSDSAAPASGGSRRRSPRLDK